MATIREPTPEEAIILFKAIEERFPHKTVGDDKWYLVTVCTVTRQSLPTNNSRSPPCSLPSPTKLAPSIPT